VECFQETDLLFGVAYLLQKARELNMPMVIYFGVGTNQGSHTGSNALCKYIDYYANLDGVNFVTAAGNETNRGHHVYYSFEEDVSYKDIELRVAEGETGFSMEIWVNGAGFFSVALVSPGGEFTGKIPVDGTSCHVSNLVLERVRICTSYHVVEPYSLRRLILIRFYTLVPGNWTVRVYNDNRQPGNFHIWLPMHGFVHDDTRFLAPTPEVVICDPGNGASLLTVGAYNHFTGGIYLYSSRGYAADGKIKPDVASAGVDITAPDLYGGYADVTGTSVAAAHVAGMSALLWEWGVVEGFSPSIRGGDIRRLLIMGAKRSGFLYPNREFGYGIADIFGAFDVMRTPIS
jgi:subtilisin family serine protease